jgi:lipoprotein-anchoring transpeptidase ErfK/SrfK
MKSPFFDMLPRLIVVDRERHTLDFYKWRVRYREYWLRYTFPVTVGKVGSETPHGLYFVQAKTRTPDWKVPEDDDYSQDLWGHIYKFGEPGNPFEGGFISLSGEESGIGLHGTTFDPMVGTASSHGCVRMRTPDLLKIYDKCEIGTPVYLH